MKGLNQRLIQPFLILAQIVSSLHAAYYLRFLHKYMLLCGFTCFFYDSLSH